MLPTTTRKRLSHLRAQIQRQASKAARSRLEKRSSEGGAGSAATANTGGPGGGGDTGGGGGSGRVSGNVASNVIGGSSSIGTNEKTNPLTSGGHNFSLSLDASSAHQHHRELHNQPNSSSSTESPSYLCKEQHTTSPASGAHRDTTTITITPASHQDRTSTNTNTPLHSAGTTTASNSASAAASATTPSGVSGPSSGTTASFSNSNLSPHTLTLGGDAGGSGHQQQHHHHPHHHHHHHHHHTKNFKQKLIAMLKKFRTDGSEEQYREALERELMEAAANSPRAIEELLEDDLLEEDDEQDDWDSISESSTPKPSLRPFFSTTTLDKI